MPANNPYGFEWNRDPAGFPGYRLPAIPRRRPAFLTERVEKPVVRLHAKESESAADPARGAAGAESRAAGSESNASD